MPTMSVDEFLGLDVKVKNSTNPSLEGLSGKIVGETMKTFSVRTSSGVKVIPKNSSVFELRLKSGEVIELRGKDVSRRLEERAWRCEAP